MLAYSHLWQNYHRDAPPGDPFANVFTDWKANTLSVLPSLEAKAAWTFARWDLQLKSRYTFIQLFGLSEDVSYINLDSASQVWKNEIGLSYRSPWEVFHLPLRPFAQFARYDLAGDIIDADLVNHFYEARAGVGIAMPHSLKPLSEVVVSGAYYFQGPLSGYSIGVSLAF